MANLSERDLQDTAEYFAAQQAPRAPHQLDPATVAIGSKKYTEPGASCHLPMFRGMGEIPRLSGQTPGYLYAARVVGSGKPIHGIRQLKVPAITLTSEER